MSRLSLFTRIEREADKTSSGRTVYRADDLEDAVMRHLQRMLNTRQGSSLSAPDYGILELSELMHHFPDTVGVMQRSIKNTILKYEPRLKNVQVRTVEPDEDQNRMMVYFEITAQLLYPDGARHPVRYSTSIDESSNVNLG